VKLAVLALAGCWTSTPAATPIAPPDPQQTVVMTRTRPMKSPCEIAVDHVIDIVGNELDKGSPFADKIDPMHAAAIDSCAETHWSTELLDCLGAVEQTSGLGQCESMMTPEQQKDVFKRVTEILSAPSPQPTP
jgi:hypothetical protein